MAALDAILGLLEIFQYLGHNRFSKHIYRMKKKMKACMRWWGEGCWVTLTYAQRRQGKSILLDKAGNDERRAHMVERDPDLALSLRTRV